MGKKSKSKSSAVKPEEPALEPEVVEAVQEQVKHQSKSALTDSFAQSAAFFGKKASYTPAVELTPEDLKSRRTVFVGNVSLDATQKDLKNHFSVCGKVENVRLRHLPIAGCAVGQAGNQKLMMKVCANKKILTTAKDNCNAYVTFVEESSVEAALKLNGTTLVQKKIRVDHCEPVIDARRSIFIGNVPFKCTDEQMLQFFTKRLKTEEDPEPIENVRLIRDRESGLGKGFGYLLLKTPALVAKTLALRNLKMETRELRVQVCGKRFKNLRGEETVKEKFEGLRASAGARARIQLKRKAGAENLDHGFATKKMKRVAAAAGLGKKLKPKHAARKAAKAAAEAAAAAKGNPSKKRKHDHSASKKVEKPKAKKPKHAARKAKQAAAKD
ncbi:RNA-binding protein [Phytophthora palmivora]|uniref:RNA-binding protein n=1 Tax=Phytophthora palmivora TaxID=4796 RepID=A0A2P4XE52_9STRA|nr:RNA-binding protein [Phytophthora palmivora]